MAFFDPHATAIETTKAAREQLSETFPAPLFSALEERTIRLARNDPMSSLDAPGRLRHIANRMFGFSELATLANPRLEALRRLAVMAWNGVRLPEGEVARFLSAGFGHEHVDGVLAMIALRR